MRPIRNRSAVGRFASVTLELEEDAVEKMEEPKEDNEDIADAMVTAVDDLEDSEEDTIDENPVTELLKVLSIDLMRSRSGENRTQHHTDVYQSDDFIFRRGQNFQMWITLSRSFNPSTDKLHLELRTGALPKVSGGTHVIIPLVEALEENRWEAALVQQDGERIQLWVNSPPTAVVGRYRLMVETDCGNSQTISTHDYSSDIYLLFNPWCKDDAVFMDSVKDREEYVLNEVGQIYYGNERQIGARTWNYGQFDEGILAICLFILEKSGTSPSGWGDPVNVARVISAMINSQDDRGVLVGNWSGDYSGGTSPTSWSGSLEILKEYHSNGGTPIKYGQCWVFAGVFTTVLRCLGIPSRTVTNFSSAHDTDVSLTTDVYLDENLDPIDDLNTDSIWNFHVWNDCWMARPDLPPGYGGWQVVDATPQETSQGTFRCGPASLFAVRSGHVYLKHDCPFVFAEVNSDKIYWQRNKDGTFTQISTEKRTVGHFISTKCVGSDERNDITDLYKHPEGTELERISVQTACSYGSKAEEFSISTSEDVSVEVTMHGEDPKMGEDVNLIIKLHNRSSKQRKIRLHSTVAVIYYTGVHKVTVRRDVTKVIIKARKVKNLEWQLKYEEYKDQLIDQAALMLTLSGRVRQTRQVLATQFNFRLRTPDIIVEPIGTAVVGEKLTVNISFTNPLPRELKDVIFHVEGLGIAAAQKIYFGDIGSHASVSLTEEFIPTRPGLRKLLVSLDCRELTQVHGVSDITVVEKHSSAP